MLPAGKNIACIVPVAHIAWFAKQLALRDVGEAHDRVQRRTQFMAHGVEKLRLMTAGLLRPFFFRAQGVLAFP